MNRVLALLFALFSSALALAVPKIGDSATYVGIFSGKNFTQTVTLTEYNNSSDSFQQLTTTVQEDGNKSVDSEWVKTSDLLSADIGKQLVDDCAGQGGVIEYVMVASQNLKTCKLPTDNGGTANIGAVPFGVVKVDLNNWTQKLDSYSFGH